MKMTAKMHPGDSAIEHTVNVVKVGEIIARSKMHPSVFRTAGQSLAESQRQLQQYVGDVRHMIMNRNAR